MAQVGLRGVSQKDEFCKMVKEAVQSNFICLILMLNLKYNRKYHIVVTFLCWCLFLVMVYTGHFYCFYVIMLLSSGRVSLCCFYVIYKNIQMQKKAHGFWVVDGTMISGEENCPLHRGLMKSPLIIL